MLSSSYSTWRSFQTQSGSLIPLVLVNYNFRWKVQLISSPSRSARILHLSNWLPLPDASGKSPVLRLLIPFFLSHTQVHGKKKSTFFNFSIEVSVNKSSQFEERWCQFWTKLNIFDRNENNFDTIHQIEGPSTLPQISEWKRECYLPLNSNFFNFFAFTNGFVAFSFEVRFELEFGLPVGVLFFQCERIVFIIKFFRQLGLEIV